jgi:methionyl-tRNA formyltransferase
MRFALAAEESVGIRAAEAIVASPHALVAVLTKGTRRTSLSGSLVDVADRAGAAVWPSNLVSVPETADRLRTSRIDVLLNVYSLVRVCEAVIAAPVVGAFNLHPGILPDVAGRNPISAALWRGDREHGVTLHHMVADFDAGPIAYQSTFEIDETISAGWLSARCAAVGIELVEALLRDLAESDASIPRRAQDLRKRAYFPPEMPQGGKIDWTLSAKRIIDFVRAYDFTPFPSPWGHPTTTSDGAVVGLVRANRTGRATREPAGTVGAVGSSGIDVAAGDEWVSVSRVVTDGRTFAAAKILRPGARLG